MKNKKLIILLACAAALLFVGAMSVTVVQTGYTGVLVTTGKVSDVTLSEGLHIKIPFLQNVVQVDTRTRKVEATGSAASKDLQTVTVAAAVNYRVLTDQAGWIYKNVGTGYESVVITPAIQESIKSITAKYTAEELITKRQEVGDLIKAALVSKVEPYGVRVEIFNIVNFEFSAEFNAAVEAKQTAEQNALKAEQDLTRIKVEAQQKIEQAKAEAESIKLIQETLAVAPQYIEYIKWTKWDGVLPAVIGDGGDLIFDVSGVTSSGSGSATTGND